MTIRYLSRKVPHATNTAWGTFLIDRRDHDRG